MVSRKSRSDNDLAFHIRVQAARISIFAGPIEWRISAAVTAEITGAHVKA
jgi:hypothetical protein